MARRILFAALLVTAGIAYGEPQYMLDYVLPRGGSRGTAVNVNLYGKFLEDPKEIVFYGAGIKAGGVTAGAKPGSEVKARFEIAADCPAGEHVLRIRTATALSEPVTFWVSRFPTVMETEKTIGENDTIAKAQSIPLNSTVEGQILPGPAMDKDYYWVQVNEGQRISVEVESTRLGTLHYGGENDLAVRILDQEGKELGRNDDSALYVQDPVLSIVAPHTGSYFIEIKQQVFYRAQQNWYRAHIGTFSRPTAIYPAGGQAGTTILARVLGDPTGERTEQIALPKQAGNFDYFSDNAPSPNVLRVSPYPNVMQGDSSVASLPVALNGILAQPRQLDSFHFTAKKDQSWKIRVYGRTLGSAVDPKFSIRAANGDKSLLAADDSKMADLGYPSARGSWSIKDQLDPVAIFKVPADGEYILSVEDTRGAAGPDHVYRVEVEPVHDAVYTHITMGDGYQIPRLVGMIVPQGNRWTLDVQLAQGLGNNYKGDIDLEAIGLPRGVSMIAPRYTKGAARMPVQFVAAANAEQQAALIELRARPVNKLPLETGSRQGFALVNRGNELPLHFVSLDKYALAVTQPAPFHIELEQPDIALAQNGELALKVKVIRHGDFKGPIEMQPDWLPPSVSKESTVTIPADKEEGTFKIHADAKAAAGVYKIAMNASTTTGDVFSGIGRVRVSSAFVDLKISEPYLSINLKHSAVERGQVAEITGDLKQNKPFPGTATVTLKRLPRGVKMLEPAPQITSQDTQVVFKVQADADALVGLYKDLMCEVTVTENGQSIHQQTGSGVLRIDPSRTMAASK